LSLERGERGSALVESVFAIAFLLTLLLGTVQVVFTLYARNVVQAAAHEGVRSAIERGGTGEGPVDAARTTVERAAGGLLTDVDVAASRSALRDGALITLAVSGRLRSLGPLPLRLSVDATARGFAPGEPP
jgi:Flp pilus assembly protein TadG